MCLGRLVSLATLGLLRKRLQETQFNSIQNYFLCSRWLYPCYTCELLFELILYQHKTVINLHKLGIYVIWLSNPIIFGHRISHLFFFHLTFAIAIPSEVVKSWKVFSNVFLTIKYHPPHSRQKLFLYLLILTLKSCWYNMITNDNIKKQVLI